MILRGHPLLLLLQPFPVPHPVPPAPGGGEVTSAKEENVGREWLSAAAMTVDGGVAVGLRLFYGVFRQKNKKGLEFRVPVRVNSVLGCTGSCGNT